MKCPYCDYTYDYKERCGGIKGEKYYDGDFYTLPVKMEQELEYDLNRVILYGCPHCSKVFID
jgi:hypothetical protein